MVARHSPQQQFKQACQIARDNNMFVVDKGDHFILYRKNHVRNICLGEVKSAAALFHKVSRCAATSNH